MSMSNKIIEKDAKVLIVSWSPVPTPKYQKIEGSGQRFFGLAIGLKKNGIKDITIAVGNIYPLDVHEVDGIKLFNYDFNDDFVAKLADYDTVIFNYAIHGSLFIANNTPKRTQVIIDVYGPAYIESLARNPKDLVNTYIGNLAAVKEVFNEVLPRGDYFLYANEAQEKFYTGVLSTLGIINQFSYKTERLLKVPFGIDKPSGTVRYENPYLEYGIKKDDFVLLWFGGLYPWFDITKVLDSIKNTKNKKVKLVIVGGNNPQNQHPDFIIHYKNTIKYIEENDLTKQVTLIDWADFATRRKYYEYANVIISINNDGKENQYSWRTRVMDYVGSTTPLITNGGDPLSDELIEAGAAFRVNSSSLSDIQDLIKNLVENKKMLIEASNNMKHIQPKYYWETVTEPLGLLIKEWSRPRKDEQIFRKKNNISDLNTDRNFSQEAKSKRHFTIIKMSKKLILKAREKGLRTTARIITDKISRRAALEYKKLFSKNKDRSPRIVIVSNQLNNTGAPFVIMDVVKQIKNKYPKLVKKIEFICFTPIEIENIDKLEDEGVRVSIYTNRDLSLQLGKDDVVVLNSFAMSRTLIFSVINSIKKGEAKKVFWYGHEASPDSFVDEDVKRIFRTLLKKDKARIFSVSNKTKLEYIRFFETTKNIEKMPFRFIFPNSEFRILKEDDFDKLKFTLTGSMMDMRKGQYPVLYAFLDFYHNCYEKRPDKYRDFSIEFIGAYEKSDLSLNAPYHIQNVIKQFKLSAEGLGDRFSIKPSMPHTQALREIESSNITICYSMSEAMGIFVYEGMAYGHPIIRNDSAGMEEQLVEGKNGYGVSSKDFPGLVAAIEKLSNRKKTSSSKLAKMSQESNKLAKKATECEYQIVDELAGMF